MISHSEAITIIRNAVEPLSPIQLPLSKAVGLTLADNVYSKTDIPAFRQSSVDGYAFSFDEWIPGNEFIIDGEIAAGKNVAVGVKPNSAVRIFTGAPLPAGADTIVMQENAKREKDRLFIQDRKLTRGSYVRQQGAEMKAGLLAMPKDAYLSAASIGFLAGLGITSVSVYPRPRICIIATGNELQQPGKPLEYGQIYDSNSAALAAGLQLMQIQDVSIEYVRDHRNAVTNTLQQALNNCDVVLLTGGVSVGDYDFVAEAAACCGTVPLFHQIRQRPGKPLYFGKKGNKLVFGLPGNPASALTCFYVYVRVALAQLSQRDRMNHSFEAPLKSDYQKAAGLTHFLKGLYDGEFATPLDGQESYRMHSFARANCLIRIDEQVTVCGKGTMVTIYPFH